MQNSKSRQKPSIKVAQNKSTASLEMRPKTPIKSQPGPLHSFFQIKPVPQ